MIDYQVSLLTLGGIAGGLSAGMSKDMLPLADLIFFKFYIYIIYTHTPYSGFYLRGAIFANRSIL